MARHLATGRSVSSVLAAATTLGMVAGAGIPAAQATTWYVSALSGKDTNTGKSTTAPFKTIGAITNSNHLDSGDIVIVMPGTYNETVSITTAGKASAYTTLMAQPGAARPVLIGAPTQPNSGAAYGTISIFAPYVRVTGFDVSWQGADGDAIQSYGPKVKNSNGVLRPTVHHLDIENNIAHDAGCGGIDLVFADYVTVKGNVTYNNGHTAPNQCSGISLYELTDFDDGSGFRNVISGNLSYNNIDLVPVVGTKYTTDGNGIIIDDNEHTQSDHVAYQGATLVYGNIVTGNGGVGITCFASKYVTVANNTAYQNQQSKTIQGAIGEFSSADGGSNTFVNNVADTAAATLPAFVDGGSTGDSWDYNLTVGGGNVTATAVKLAMGTHNLPGVNPDFVAASLVPASANFELSKISPALQAGLALNYGVADFGGAVMSAGARPNLGAYTR